MASRRSSARIPGDAEVTQAGGRSGGAGGVASKKRAAAGGTMVEEVFGEPDKEKRRPVSGCGWRLELIDGSFADL
jgi:hypothetical protein